MLSNRIFFLTLILAVLLLFSACVTETPPASPEKPTAPVEAGDLTPYPYPGPDADFVRPTDSTEPYPYPDTDSEPAAIIDPYPGVEAPNQDINSDILLIVDGFAPVGADKDFNRGQAFIDSTDIILKESFPIQVDLILIGNLPTPCHQLRVVVTDPDADGHIRVEVYSISDPDQMCIQVLEPFEAVIPLGEFTEGNFTLLINDEPMGQFNLP